MATANNSVAERIIDQAAAEVQDKMKYFESRSNQLLGEMSNAMTTLSGVTVEPVGSAPELPRPENAQFLTIDMPDTPELNVTVPTPHLQIWILKIRLHLHHQSFQILKSICLMHQLCRMILRSHRN